MPPCRQILRNQDRRRWLAWALGLGSGLVGGLGGTAHSQTSFDTRTRGLAVLVRHAATEPGIGDPPGYRLDVCSTQRNLSIAGQDQARRLASTLAQAGLVPTEVMSSHWCRCQDTARLAFGRVSPWRALDSFFDQAEREPAQTAALRTALANLAAGQVAVWVTHQVNISALTGEGTAFGDAVVVQATETNPPGLRVLARLRTPA